MELMKRTYYPADTSPQDGPHCDFETDSEFFRRWYSSTCLLSPGHEGEHNYSANWNAHIEVEKTFVGGVEVAFRSWHDNRRPLVVHSKAEAEEILSFLRQAFEDLLDE